MKMIKMQMACSITFKELCDKYLINCRERNLREGTIYNIFCGGSFYGILGAILRYSVVIVEECGMRIKESYRGLFEQPLLLITYSLIIHLK